MAELTDADLYGLGARTLLACWEVYARGCPGAAVSRSPGVAAAVFPDGPERAFLDNALLERDLTGEAPGRRPPETPPADPPRSQAVETGRAAQNRGLMRTVEPRPRKPQDQRNWKPGIKDPGLSRPRHPAAVGLQPVPGAGQGLDRICLESIRTNSSATGGCMYL